MKTFYFTIFTYLFLMGHTSHFAHAQWSNPQILFPGIAYPDQIGEENLVCPVLCPVLSPDGTTSLIWSNRVGDQVKLVYSNRSNGEWSPITEIANFDPVSMQPTAVYDSQGILHCAWVSIDENETFSIFYSRLFSGFGWEEPVKVSDTLFALNAHPRLIIDNLGNVRLFYNAAVKVGNYVSYYIKHFIIDRDTPGITINQLSPGSTSSHAFNPHVFADQEGMLHCYWYDHGGNTYNILTSIFDGSQWSEPDVLAGSNLGTYIYDEMPLVVDQNQEDDVIALWMSLDPETGQFRMKTHDGGWGNLINIGEKTFRNANGLFDSNDYFHVVGNADSYQGGHLYYHVMKDGNWEHQLIEAGTSQQIPGFPSLIIKEDTLFSYYVRFTANENQLVESYTILDHLTPVDILPFTDFNPVVFPNPINNFSIIKIDSKNDQQVEINLLDILGAELGSFRIEPSSQYETEIPIRNVFNINELKSGVYFLRIKDQQIDKTIKILKI